MEGDIKRVRGKIIGGKSRSSPGRYGGDIGEIYRGATPCTIQGGKSRSSPGRYGGDMEGDIKRVRGKIIGGKSRSSPGVG